MGTGWNHCTECPEDEGDWPTECFDLDRGMCHACAHEHPRRMRRPCSRCQRTVHTLDRVETVLCQPCRRQLRGLRTPQKRAAERKRARRYYQRKKRERTSAP